MVELSKERVEQILHEETMKKEELETILRSIYTRYMHLFENYFADLDALNDDKVAELKKYHEETKSLVRYYYLDIPQDICTDIREFENKYCAKLLGSDWHDYIMKTYEDFRENSRSNDKSEEYLKAEFTSEALSAFYEVMDYIFREGFGTESRAAKTLVSGIKDLFFGKDS